MCRGGPNLRDAIVHAPLRTSRDVNKVVWTPRLMAQAAEFDVGPECIRDGLGGPAVDDKVLTLNFGNEFGHGHRSLSAQGKEKDITQFDGAQRRWSHESKFHTGYRQWLLQNACRTDAGR